MEADTAAGVQAASFSLGLRLVGIVVAPFFWTAVARIKPFSFVPSFISPPSKASNLITSYPNEVEIGAKDRL